MILSKFIAGLQILAPHYKDGDGYQLGADHDVVYVYATATPLSPDEFERMVDLGWNQEGRDSEGGQYDPESSWYVFT